MKSIAVAIIIASIFIADAWQTQIRNSPEYEDNNFMGICFLFFTFIFILTLVY